MIKTLQKLSLLTALILSGSLASSYGQEKINLKGKLITGNTYVLEHTMKMLSKTPIPGQAEAMEMKMDMKSGMELSIVQENPKEKSITVKYTGMKMKMNMMGQEMEMDAKDPSQKATLGAILDMEPRMIYDNDDNFVRLEGMDEMGENPMTASFTNSDSLKQMVQGAMGDLPEGEVGPGHEWESEVEFPLQGMGKMVINLRNKFEKYEEVDGAKCAVIKFAGTFDGELTPGEGMSIKFKEGSTFSGTYYYDPKISYNRKQDIETDLTMEMDMGGEKMTIPMNQSQTIKLVKVKKQKKK